MEEFPAWFVFLTGHLSRNLPRTDHAKIASVVHSRGGSGHRVREVSGWENPRARPFLGSCRCRRRNPPSRAACDIGPWSCTYISICIKTHFHYDMPRLNFDGAASTLSRARQRFTSGLSLGSIPVAQEACARDREYREDGNENHQDFLERGAAVRCDSRAWLIFQAVCGACSIATRIATGDDPRWRGEFVNMARRREVNDDDK